ncbi:hypothetical protein like AT1G55865 [Hibiscus trionum]|uniref:Uncharacterized protein n=1 Tax=Hibiscus trionum TaxID=183268 RepID=A0A9W7HXH1_HIBTR|nr:hypothetical protein like AT1G55865 [Hibiscus trionum]
MASDNEVAVFTDTNIGTHLAMAISPDTTVGDFQSELERTHQSCFPELGKIEVHASMVRRKSCFYHLPSSMPIKYAFQHQVGSWFLHIEAKTSKHSYGVHFSNFAATEVGDCKCHGNNPTGSLVPNTGEGTAACIDVAEWNLGSMKKNRTKISSSTISSAGVNDGCPLNSNGVSQHASSPGSGRAMQDLPKEPRTKANNSYCSSVQIEGSPPFMVRTPAKQSLYMSRADRSSGVGKRIIIASNNIRVSDKQRPITLSNFRDRKLLCYRNFSRAKFLAFEISDSEEEDVNAL